MGFLDSITRAFRRAPASTSVDCQFAPYVSAFGNSSAPGGTTITLQFSQDNTNFYNSQVTQVLSGAGDFAVSATVGARYLRLISSGASTITATIACKD